MGFMVQQVEEDDVPLSQVFRVSAPLPLQEDKEEGKDGDQCKTSGRPSVENLIGNLEERVAAVEVALSNAMGGIRNILRFMSDIKGHFAKDAGVQSTGDVEGIILEALAEGGSVPPQEPAVQTKVDTGNLARGNRLACSHSNSAKPSLPHTPVGRGASIETPFVVLDDTSSQSVGHKRANVRDTTIQDSPAKRVHMNPRIRPLPFEGRLGVTGSNSPKGKAAVGPSDGPTVRPQKKDPPVNEDVAEVGGASDTDTRLPALGPKSHSVSTLHPSL